MKNLLVVFTCAALVSCSSRGRIQDGVDLKAMMQREFLPLKVVDARSSDDFIIFKTEASDEVTITAPAKDETYYGVRVPLGKGVTPMNCLIYKENVDLATSLSNINSSVMERITQHEIAAIDMGVLGRAPYMRIDYHYFVPSKNGMAAGYFKSAIAEKPGATLLCHHDDVGYKESFFRIFSRIATSLNSKSIQSAAKARYTEIFVYTSNNQPVGINVTELYSSQAGKNISKNKTAFLFKQAADQISTIDSASVEVEEKDGSVGKGTYVGVTNNQVAYEIDFTQKTKTEYQATGKFQGKPLNATIKSSTKISGGYNQMKILRRMAKNKKPQAFGALAYDPQVTPTKAIDVYYSPKSANKSGLTYKMKVGKIETTMSLDPDGSARSIQVPLGASYVTADRKYKNGVY